MYLKKIEIQGFKSFAHKTVLSFDRGMTAIVGPNGSGKSNIADAVRWVLGEQKARTLRGSSMQDVIFAGTEFRKPLGFAFVALTFDNSDKSLNVDYSEVTVSRKLFRSGESEYCLNGQAVRLKDIQELFFDTGIGKEGYSIIGQGQVESIVSGRPEDRRGLFDEACGITKFKKRKAAAIKKLEEENADLIRITDILHELEKRVGPLEKQSQGAREYLKLRDELKVYELNLFVRDAEALINELEETEKNINIVSGDLESVEKEDTELGLKNEELSDALKNAEDAFSTANEEKHKGELLLNNLEGQINVHEAEIRSIETEISVIMENRKRLDAENRKKTATASEYLNSIRNLKKDLSAFLLKEDGIEPSDIAGGGINAKVLIEKLDTFEEKLKKHYPEVEAVADEETESGQAASDVLVSDEFEFEEPEWLKAIRNKKDDLSDIREKESQNEVWVDSTKKELEELENRKSSVLASLTDREGRLAGTVSRLDTLKGLAERYEGYGQSVQNVMQLKNRIRGIHGVVADLISTEEKFETAIETALGGRIQNIVTESEETAKAIIEILKKNRLGRATFLPVDAVHGKTSEEYRKAEQEDGCLGLASDLVEYDSRYEDIVRSLLGNTLVAKNVDCALRIAGRHKHELRIVTLEGELLSPGGSIAGGSFRSQSSLMSRQREISELEKEIDHLRSGIKDLREDLREIESSINSKNTDLNHLLDEQKKINERKNSISFGILSDMKLKMSNLDQSVSFVSENISRIIEESEGYVKSCTELDERSHAGTLRISELNKNINARNEDIRAIREGVADAEKRMAKEALKKEELSCSQNEYFTRKDELSSRKLDLQKESMRLDSILEKDRQKLDAITTYIWDEYQTGLIDAKKAADPDIGPDSDLKQNISRIKNKIKELGPVNIQAIEEYKEVSERYELTKTQHADIVKAQDAVLDIIKELDDGMKKQFTERFSLIRNEFSIVFAKLFGGGEASLEMVFDEESGENDELTCGIAIIAQPPGKRLQNMMQLSGGEKALTAIALLFAIQNLKPSPFCLLDEIEAALDDSNVIRFARYVKMISDRSQFILITHRRGTMEESDRLYGVTMQEKGVTSLVSVDLVSDSVN